ncbi:MAG TPA: adenylate cyclase regulatory domain-containing protein [Solirubrobacteraceae bacterium]|nr:adenylate cyclase regulatory domain-containing protein [Solirubrobacteraceae bacterium]
MSRTRHPAAGREALIERLREAGATDEQIRAAIEHDRLALLPAELLLSRDCRYTIDEAAERSGVDREFLERHLVATGMVRARAGEKVLSDTHLDALERIKRTLDAGLPEELLLRIDHVFNRGIALVADGMVDIIFAQVLRSSTSEAELGLRIERVARALREDLAVYLAATMETHLRERIEREALSRAELEAGALPGARETAVCFADLVDFTRLSDQGGSEQVTEIATAFADLAAEVAEPPVRLVKLIGDAAMLVSAEPVPLVDAAFDLRDRARGAGLPALRIGVALGPALERLGDWYGRTVNLASRLTAAAPPDSIVASPEVASRLGDAFDVREVGTVTLKGLAEPIEMCHLHRA